MTRKEIYQKIKDEGLAEKIKTKFGKNYTNVKTKDLERWVKANDFAMSKMDHILENSRSFNKPETVKEDNFCDSCPFYDGFQQLVSMLVAHRALTPIEGEELMDVVFK